MGSAPAAALADGIVRAAGANCLGGVLSGTIIQQADRAQERRIIGIAALTSDGAQVLAFEFQPYFRMRERFRWQGVVPQRAAQPGGVVSADSGHFRRQRLLGRTVPKVDGERALALPYGEKVELADRPIAPSRIVAAHKALQQSVCDVLEVRSASHVSFKGMVSAGESLPSGA